MIKTHQKREPVFTSTAIFPEDTRDPHIPYRKNRNSFFFFKRGFKNQYRGVWGCLWIGSCVLWTEYWESYSCSPWLVVTEPYSIVAVFQRVARHPLVEILTTLNSSGYDNGAITKVNLKKKLCLIIISIHAIHHFYVAHNATYLPLIFCATNCFKISPGYYSRPKRNWRQ